MRVACVWRACSVRVRAVALVRGVLQSVDVGNVGVGHVSVVPLCRAVEAVEAWRRSGVPCGADVQACMCCQKTLCQKPQDFTGRAARIKRWPAKGATCCSILDGSIRSSDEAATRRLIPRRHTRTFGLALVSMGPRDIWSVNAQHNH